MAYWLYCQACKEWGKSATPLSEDKACKFCGNLLMKAGTGGKSVSQADDAEVMHSPEEAPSADVGKARVSEALPEATEEAAAEAAAEIAGIAEEVDEVTEAKTEDAAPEGDETAEETGEAVPDEAADEEDEELVTDEEKESSQENDVVKVSEVRVITDKNEKKERLAKKRH